MSSGVTPQAVAPSPTSESSSTSSNVTPNSNQHHEKPAFPPPLLLHQLNDNQDTADNINSSSFSIHDNKENKDDSNTINNNNKNYSHNMNSNNSSTATIVGSNSGSTMKGLTFSHIPGTNTLDEAKRSCNRCQNCTGFSSHEWRNTCTSCRCPRSCHDISIGARCCGFHRAGFDQSSSSTVSSGQTTHLQKNNSVSTVPLTSSSQNQTPSTMQPPLPTGNAPAIENSISPSSTVSTTKMTSSGLSCSRTSAAESAGYSWMPQVCIKNR